MRMSSYPYQTLLTQTCVIMLTNMALVQQQPLLMPYPSLMSANGSLTAYLSSTPHSALAYSDEDDEEYPNDLEPNDMENYDVGDRFQQEIPSSTLVMSTEHFLNESSDANFVDPFDQNDYPDDVYQDNDDYERHIYADTMSVNRPESNHPTIDITNKKYFDLSSTTSRIPFVTAHLFSKPAVLVAIVGGIVFGILSAIILVMFLIYRMRKKDEGSYVLDEGPCKSPSHTYTKVSSREFFA